MKATVKAKLPKPLVLESLCLVDPVLIKLGLCLPLNAFWSWRLGISDGYYPTLDFHLPFTWIQQLDNRAITYSVNDNMSNARFPGYSHLPFASGWSSQFRERGSLGRLFCEDRKLSQWPNSPLCVFLNCLNRNPVVDLMLETPRVYVEWLMTLVR